MTHCLVFAKSPLAVLKTASACGALLFLAACGGGGGGGDPAPTAPGTPTLTVTDVTTTTPSYGQNITLTVTGTLLTEGIAVASPGCTNLVVHPTLTPANAATTAYYQCQTNAMGTFDVNVTKASNAASLRVGSFTVPAPQVTFTVSNTLGVTGNLVVTLAPDKVPNTVKNFLRYVNEGYYDNVVFHRLVQGNIIQGGAFTPYAAGGTPIPKATYNPIALETGSTMSNVKYSIAMARTLVKDSATSQFYFNLKDNAADLDPRAGFDGYIAFGMITGGTSVADAMSAAPCAPYTSQFLTLPCSPNPQIVISQARQTR